MNKYLILLTLVGSLFPSLIAQENKSDAVEAHFMVFSDPHYYDPSLGTEGEAFQEYLDNDRKLLKESRELVGEAVKMVLESKPGFVIVPGDLTKDGARISHEKFAEMMDRLEEEDISVYVVPGNHDISNGSAYAYRGDKKVSVENVGPSEFRKLYDRFGYGEAIMEDTNSLSYVAEPAEGLWLFGLDACLYRENEPDHHAVTDGEFQDATLDWIEDAALQGKAQGKTMIAMMHHGILEHYQKQDKFFGEYVVNNHKKVSKKLAELGISVVFTGHYHAQDITGKQWKDKFIFDVETGSLVTYPCPVRDVRMTGPEMHIQSTFIKSLPDYQEGFEEFTREYVHSGVAGIAEQVMIDMWLKPQDAYKLSGQIGDAFIAHYQGDEPPEDRHLDLKGVGLLGRLMILTKKRMIKELHTDLPPADNEVTINLITGEVR